MRDAALNLTMSLETKAAAGLDGRMKATRQDTIQAASLAILAVLAVGWFLNAAQAVILPIILGLLVASLLDAVSRLFKQVPALDRLMPDGLRVGIAAMELCRPLPFHAVAKPRVSTTVRRALTGLLSRKDTA